MLMGALRQCEGMMLFRIAAGGPLQPFCFANISAEAAADVTVLAARSWEGYLTHADDATVHGSMARVRGRDAVPKRLRGAQTVALSKARNFASWATCVAQSGAAASTCGLRARG